MINYLQQTISSTGEMGTLMNMGIEANMTYSNARLTYITTEQHNMPSVITSTGITMSFLESKRVDLSVIDNECNTDLSETSDNCTQFYNYVGCYQDEPDRDLTGPSESGSMGPMECAAFCVGYPYFGLQYGYSNAIVDLCVMC